MDSYRLFAKKRG